MEAILHFVPPEMVLTFGAKKMTKEAWDTIKTLCIGVESVRESKAQTLCLQYEEIRFKADEQVDDFTMRLHSLVNELAMLGDPIDYKMVLLKLLHVVPRQYKQLALSIESLVDLSTMTIEELGGQLKVVEERDDEVGKRVVSSATAMAPLAVGEAPSREAECTTEAEAAPRAAATTVVVDLASPSSRPGLGNLATMATGTSAATAADRDCHTRIAAKATTTNLVQANMDGEPTMMLARVEPMQESPTSSATMAPTTTHSMQECGVRP